jgi:transposase-like protein
MAERGIRVDHSTIHGLAVQFLPRLLKRFDRRKRMVSGRWHVGETYIEVLAHRVRSRGNTDTSLGQTGAPALWL